MDENEEERVERESVCVCVYVCRERNRKHGGFSI